MNFTHKSMHILAHLIATIGAGLSVCAARERRRNGEKRMDIKRSGSQPSGKGPADWFTGTVRVDPLFSPPEPARVRGALVTFEPGARTAWHTHPLGQTLIVTAGCGWAQREGGPIEEIRPGDVVWFPPGEKHWHGASATDGDDPYRDSGEARRQKRRLAGEGHRRPIPPLIAAAKSKQ